MGKVSYNICGNIEIHISFPIHFFSENCIIDKIITKNTAEPGRQWLM
jgi:hypothetical protein